MNSMELEEKVRRSIEIIKRYEPEVGYHLAFSGGKDSVVVYDLAKRAGVKFKAYFYVGGNEPPEVYRFIRENYPDVEWLYAEYSFTKLIRMKGFMPTMHYRYCCHFIKENWGHGEYVLTGIRRDESVKRRDYDYVMKPKRGAKRVLINPILDWKESDVWKYIRNNSLPYCELYDISPLKRLGCAFCPFQKPALQRWAKERWPQLWNGIRRAMQDVLNRKPHPVFGKDADAYLDWWISQLSIEEYLRQKRQIEMFGKNKDEGE